MAYVQDVSFRQGILHQQKFLKIPSRIPHSITKVPLLSRFVGFLDRRPWIQKNRGMLDNSVLKIFKKGPSWDMFDGVFSNGA